MCSHCGVCGEPSVALKPLPLEWFYTDPERHHLHATLDGSDCNDGYENFTATAKVGEEFTAQISDPGAIPTRQPSIASRLPSILPSVVQSIKTDCYSECRNSTRTIHFTVIRASVLCGTKGFRLPVLAQDKPNTQCRSFHRLFFVEPSLCPRRTRKR